MKLTNFDFLIDDALQPRTGAWNMALDHALLESVQTSPRAVLRLYRWQPACLSFGRNQPARGLYDESVARSMGVDIVRRPTGGLAVMHDCELTYAVIAPVDLLGGPRESYQRINAGLVAGLQKLGVPAELSGGVKRSAFGTMHPCFAEPAAGEVVVGGRKLIGSAQRCEKRTLLQHGSILLDGSQDVVSHIAAVPFELNGQATTIAATQGSVPSLEALVDALAAGFETATQLVVKPSVVASAEVKRASELEALYHSPEWTWRR